MMFLLLYQFAFMSILVLESLSSRVEFVFGREIVVLVIRDQTKCMLTINLIGSKKPN